MFTDKSYESRLSAWSGFRSSLEKSVEPLQDVVKYYSQATLVSQRYDPWDQFNWPTPWTLVFENKYFQIAVSFFVCQKAGNAPPTRFAPFHQGSASPAA